MFCGIAEESRTLLFFTLTCHQLLVPLMSSFFGRNNFQQFICKSRHLVGSLESTQLLKWIVCFQTTEHPRTIFFVKRDYKYSNCLKHLDTADFFKD